MQNYFLLSLKTTKSIFAALIFLILQSHINLAIAEVDECKLFKEKVAEYAGPRNLDDDPTIELETFGIEIAIPNEDWGEGTHFPYVNYVNPEFLYYDERELEASKLDYSDVLEINGLPADQLSEGDILQAQSKQEISYLLKGFDEPITLKKQDLQRFEIYTETDLEVMTGIDTKNSNFGMNFSTRFRWYDEALASIGMEVNALLDQNDETSGFYCIISKDIFSDHLYELPNLRPKFFMNEEPPAHSPISITYTPPIECDDACTAKEREVGFAELEYTTTYKGLVRKSFELEKFPFDTHHLHIFLEQNKGLPYYLRLQRDYRVGVYSSAKLEESLENLRWNSQEWKVLSISDFHEYFMDPDLVMATPVISYAIGVERLTTYYIYKIILPVAFILLVTYSVFWIGPRDIESRLTVSIVSFLTLIAYNFVIQSEIPTLGYLTFMDGFILLGYLFAGIPTLTSVASKHMLDIGNTEGSKRLDIYLKIAYPPGFVFSVAALFVAFIP